MRRTVRAPVRTKFIDSGKRAGKFNRPACYGHIKKAATDKINKLCQNPHCPIDLLFQDQPPPVGGALARHQAREKLGEHTRRLAGSRWLNRAVQDQRKLCIDSAQEVVSPSLPMQFQIAFKNGEPVREVRHRLALHRQGAKQSCRCKVFLYCLAH
jgi:hypothetical protein